MIVMIDNASISIRLQNLEARLRVPDYLKFNSSQRQRLLRDIADLEALFDEVEHSS